MKSLYLSRLTILFVLLLGWTKSSFAQTLTYNTPSNTAVNYTVPAGVTAIGVDMLAAAGGSSYSNWGIGGGGGRVQCTLAVTAGQVLSIYVGGKGQNLTGSSCCSVTAPGGVGGAQGGASGPYYYPAGGGGSSEIRIGASRLIVAGGGGGGGSVYCNTEHGGAGGGLTGANGQICASPSYISGYNPTGGSQTAGGVASNNGAVGTQTSGSNGVYYAGGGGGGYWGGGGGYYYAGGGGGSSYTDPVRATNVVHTQGANLPSSTTGGNGVVILCVPNVGFILGNVPVCTGSTLSLSATGSGGTFTSSDPTIATVSTTGLLTGVSAGTAIVTYAVNVTGCGSGFTTTTVTVNPIAPPVGGVATACVGTTGSLTDAGTGTWSSGTPTVATIVPSTGTFTGLVPGTATMTFTLTSTGCTATKLITINPTPASITGVTNVCAGGATTTLSDISLGGSWSSGTPSVATVAGTGVVTGVAAGTTIVNYTMPTGCSISTSVLVNPLPSAITGSTTVCEGSATALSDATSGGTWSSSNTSQATVAPGSGVVTGISAGTPNVVYTLSTGCFATTSLLVNPLPAAITGVTTMCEGGSTTLSSTTTGGIWTSTNATLATVSPLTGAVSGLSAGTPSILYTLGTGCAASKGIVINPLPTAYNITGGGGYCVGTTGVHVGLNFSSSGVNYKLYNGSSLVAGPLGGSNAGLDFGLMTATGIYTATGLNSATGCANNMAGSVTIAVNPLPNVFTVSGGGNYCPGGTGVHINLSGSDASASYQLYVGSTTVGGAVPGTGGSIDFGPQTAPGIYTVVAVNPTTGCSINMSGTATVGLNSVPNIYSLNAGGGYCVGGTGIDVVLSSSDLSVSYQLMIGGVPTGSAMPGTGGTIHFGLRTTPGIYTVSATSSITGCSVMMSGSTNVAVNPLPNVYAVSGGGSYCTGGTGVHVNLNFSNTGINYLLYRGLSLVATIPGSNAGLDMGAQTVAGTYTVLAVDPSSTCQSNMLGSASVAINPLPNAFAVTGGGNYCAGGSGLHVGLSGSASGLTYQLYFNSFALGAPMPGTGLALDFGAKTGAGVYTVVASNGVTSCTNNMTGSATIGISTLPTAHTVAGVGTSYCAGSGGIDILLDGSDGGINYQLYRGATIVGSPMPGVGTGLDFGFQIPTGLYTVKAIDASTGCSSMMAGSANVVMNLLPVAYPMTGGGGYCNGGIGVHIGLGNSTTGVSYQLFNSSGAVGTPVIGVGSAIDFGYSTSADLYTVVATDPASGCTNNMTGTETVFINPLPAVNNVTGGGTYCLGLSGELVGVDGSETGIVYQLYKGTASVGSPVPGVTGSPVDFGLHTAAGIYTVKATNSATTCWSDQAGNAVIAINPLPVVQTVGGGGTICSSGPGTSVTLISSASGVSYELFHSGSGIGSLSGTGSGLDFGLQTAAGGYNVVATDDITGCTSNMSGTAIITILPQPATQVISGGGGYCAGGTGRMVSMGGSESGIQYQLYNGTTAVGSLVPGTGFSINFGLETAPGAYSVVASPGTACNTPMSGAATVVVNPLPTAYPLAGGGSICNGSTGVDVSLTNSQSGVVYQLMRGTTAVGSPVSGTGLPIDLGMQTVGGIYTLVATDATTLCSTTISGVGAVTVSTLALPVPFNVAGGGNYCIGGNGVHVTLDGSVTNVNYALYHNTVLVAGSIHAGTGTEIDFGLQTATGSYTIMATDAATSCTNKMIDSATVGTDVVLTPVVNIAQSPSNFVKGQRDTLTANATNAGTPTYQWFHNGYAIAGATNARYISNKFVDNDTFRCDVTSVGTCGGHTTGKSIVVHVGSNVGVQQFTSGNGNVNINVVPNPNKGIFSITGDLGIAEDQELNIEITDLLGHVVYTEKTIAKGGDVNTRVQLSNVANGMYILSVHSDAGRKVFHVVIEQ